MQTSNEFPEVRINVDGAWKVSSEIGDCQRRIIVGEEDLKLANITVDLDERVHISRRRNLWTYSATTALSRNQMQRLRCNEILAA